LPGLDSHLELGASVSGVERLPGALQLGPAPPRAGPGGPCPARHCPGRGGGWRLCLGRGDRAAECARRTHSRIPSGCLISSWRNRSLSRLGEMAVHSGVTTSRPSRRGGGLDNLRDGHATLMARNRKANDPTKARARSWIAPPPLIATATVRLHPSGGTGQPSRGGNVYSAETHPAPLSQTAVTSPT
jgi:hypothetical protein